MYSLTSKALKAKEDKTKENSDDAHSILVMTACREICACLFAYMGAEIEKNTTAGLSELTAMQSYVN